MSEPKEPQVFLKLKPEQMPESGTYNRTIGTTKITYSGKKAKAFTVKEARVALGTGDFELADPALEEISLPFDFPHFADLTAGGKYKDLESVRAAGDKDLLDLPNIGRAGLASIRAYQPTTAATSGAGGGEVAQSNQTAAVAGQIVSTSSANSASGEGIF